MDLASLNLAESAGLSLEASEKLWYDSIMKLTIHLLKDPRAGFNQVRYMERFLWIGKNTGVRVFMDRLDILLTYLPLFPPMKGEVLKELSDLQKATFLYYALPNYYIKKWKRLTLNPSRCLSRNCSNLLSTSRKLRLTLERILRAILGIAKSRKLKPQFLGSRGVKVKIIRRVEEKRQRSRNTNVVRSQSNTNGHSHNPTCDTDIRRSGPTFKANTGCAVKSDFKLKFTSVVKSFFGTTPTERSSDLFC
jgi:hypothetical protein